MTKLTSADQRKLGLLGQCSVSRLRADAMTSGLQHLRWPHLRVVSLRMSLARFSGSRTASLACRTALRSSYSRAL